MVILSFNYKAAGDGIMKLWNISKGTCVNTFEKHDGRIWAFDRSRYTEDGTFLALIYRQIIFNFWRK